jgi:single-strand DNA-binding protein
MEKNNKYPDVNTIVVSGGIVSTPELKTFNGTGKVCRTRLAINGYKDTTYINLVMWGNKAETLSKYGKKGNKISLTGRLVLDEYKGDSIYEIHAEDFNFLPIPAYVVENKKENNF